MANRYQDALDDHEKVCTQAQGLCQKTTMYDR
jgi:hypothetical protein